MKEITTMHVQSTADLESSRAPVTASGQETVVFFPDGKRRERSPIFAHNELFIAAPPSVIWAWLVRAAQWPEWYGNARDVDVEGGAADLALGTRFHWTTFGVRVHTVVEELVPERRLSWSGRGLGSTAYHGWVITPAAGGAHVVTEETQQGFVASAGRLFLRRGLHKWHQRWLEGLAHAAASGAPDASSR